jgi:hypothetical protein
MSGLMSLAFEYAETWHASTQSYHWGYCTMYIVLHAIQAGAHIQLDYGSNDIGPHPFGNSSTARYLWYSIMVVHLCAVPKDSSEGQQHLLSDFKSISGLSSCQLCTSCSDFRI